MLVCLYVRLVASNFVVFTVELTVVADDKPMADDTSVKFTSSLELDVRKMCYCRDVSLDIVQEALLMLKAAGITIKKAKEARGPCFFVFADKKKIGRAKTKADVPVVVAKYRDKLKKQLESGDSHLPVTFTSLPVPLGPDLRCSAAAADAATQQGSVVQGSRMRSVVSSYDDTRRREGGAARPAGPGRGYKKAKRPGFDTTAVKDNNRRLLSTQAALLDGSATVDEVRSALRSEAKAHSEAKAQHRATKRKLTDVTRRMDTATALLMKDFKYGEDDGADKRRRVAIADICGEGFADLNGSYFRKKKAAAMAFIRDQVGSDVRKQMELCLGLMKRFALEDPAAQRTEVLLSSLKKKQRRAARAKLKAGEKAAGERAEMVETIMSGLASFFDELKGEYAGRYPHEARVAQQAVSAAVMSAAHQGMASMIGRLVHCDRHILSKGLERSHANHEARLRNEAPSWYDEDEKSCNAYPEDYREFLVQQWVVNSRQSENQNDECKSPCINTATGDPNPSVLKLA